MGFLSTGIGNIYNEITFLLIIMKTKTRDLSTCLKRRLWIVADDPGLYSSQNEQDTRCVARAALVPVLEPSDSQEAKDFVKEAYRISEEYDTPVILRTTTRLAHSQGPVVLEDRVEPEDKP